MAAGGVLVLIVRAFGVVEKGDDDVGVVLALDAGVVLEVEARFLGEVEVGFLATYSPDDLAGFVRDFVEGACGSGGDEEVAVGEEVDGVEMAMGGGR